MKSVSSFLISMFSLFFDHDFEVLFTESEFSELLSFNQSCNVFREKIAELDCFCNRNLLFYYFVLVFFTNQSLAYLNMVSLHLYRFASPDIENAIYMFILIESCVFIAEFDWTSLQ